MSYEVCFEDQNMCPISFPGSQRDSQTDGQTGRKKSQPKGYLTNTRDDARLKAREVTMRG